MSKYTVEFYPGEDDRLPEWLVVEDKCNIVWKTTNMLTGEQDAHEMAFVFQEEYNQEFFAEFG